ncbi:hypothetical protein [Roseibacillus persicicus]|uniref:Uncharacterized protein n=1 Tax=Roseibacillus persicicus TaxID=454148 RepID=A0A918TXT0_9BACT|nr:hypothetical protein [Roseibacillus persicicus]GHC67864.1 hypothetical protein GCM10007100_39980 [Roseibacillus persicicus]
MNVVQKVLIEAVVYLGCVEGSDDREDDDLKLLEWIFAELQQATSAELESLLLAVKKELSQSQDPIRTDALEGMLDALSS